MKKYTYRASAAAQALFAELTQEQRQKVLDAAALFPVADFEVDSADGFVTVLDVPLSFIRIHEKAVIYIITAAETEELERIINAEIDKAEGSGAAGTVKS